LKIITDKNYTFETVYKITFFLFIILTVSNCLVAQSIKQNDEVLIIKNGTVIPSPNDSIIKKATIVIKNGKIISVGNKPLAIKEKADTIDATNCYVLAGFWNSHVHFIEPKWIGADTITNKRLEIQLKQFLTCYGFDYVFDIGSYLDNTLAIKKRIKTKQIKGPDIFTTGMLFAPRGGQPFYLSFHIPELSSPVAAKEMVTQTINNGANAIKIYSGVPTSSGQVVYMNAPTIKAVTSTAHSFHKLVFAHPQTDSGVALAVQNGVDIIAHTTLGKMWSDELIAKMIANKISLTPTFKLYDFLAKQEGLSDSSEDEAMRILVQELKQFAKRGGDVLFGTDIGYITDYNPEVEYVYMQKAGLSFRQILASLTTAPASKFNKTLSTGKIQKGMDADLIILSASPLENIKNLTGVLYTIKHGEIIYSSNN
jgi:imidazolonepropionase-like amidohydrolase